ncbi:MAG: oligosaccharide flippase family protein, partial [Arcobacter sp.]|nr:oligosaccharide flippase family protein [Arcobacter sp.]
KILKILKISYPMLFSSSFAMILGWVNTLLLAYFISEAGVGIYGSAEKLANITGISLLAINSIATPKFAEAYSTDNYKQLKQVTQKSTKMIFFTSAPILLVMIVFGKELLSLYGEDFEKGYWVLFFICITKFVSSMAGSVGYLLQMTGYQKVYQNVIFIAVLINLLFCFMLIPKYGYTGAAIAKCISTVFWNVVLVILVKKKIGFWSFYLPQFLKNNF